MELRLPLPGTKTRMVFKVASREGLGRPNVKSLSSTMLSVGGGPLRHTNWVE